MNRKPNAFTPNKALSSTHDARDTINAQLTLNDIHVYMLQALKSIIETVSRVLIRFD